MENFLRKGRSLQLEGIADGPVKVTVGFKCEGHEKIALAHEAQQFAMTLSEYVEYVVSLRHSYQQDSLVTVQDVSDLKQASAEQQANIYQLKQALAVYENNKQLQGLLSANKGRRLAIKDQDGNELTLVINQVADVFEVMVNSFKIS